MANRTKATQFILTYLDKIAPGGYTTKLYADKFKAMDDKAFDEYMKNLESGKEHLVFFAPNFSKPAITVKRNIEIAKELGHEFFERLWIGASGDSPAYLTPVKYMVMDIPIRRASQLLTKKIKIPENNRTVDVLTGQPTGASKGASVSYEEMKVLASIGLDNTIIELMKYRGGDVKGFHAMNAMISRYGTANIKTLANFASGVESTKTFSTFLKAMHLKNTLVG